MTRRRTALWAAVAVGVVLATFVGVLATRDSAADKQAQSPLLGKAAPPIRGTALDGSEVALADLRGRWVLVNFFASWCIPCEREHPELVKFTERHEARGDASVLAVIFDDRPDEVREFFDRKGGNWPVIDDPKGQVALDYGVRGPPESFLISPEGVVVSKVIGEVRADQLDQVLRSAPR